MKFLYLYFLSLFFIFNVNASTNFEKISNDFQLIYNSWNNGELNKYENIFRRDNENAFNTCVAVTCGSGLLEHYNRVLNSLQSATGEKKGMFGKKSFHSLLGKSIENSFPFLLSSIAFKIHDVVNPCNTPVSKI